MSRVTFIALILCMSCASTKSATHVDHIMLGISNLDAGIHEFESLTGIRPIFGGEHPHLGTHNAIASLGPETYVEIIAPRSGVTLAADLADLPTLEHLTPVGWAVAMPDVASLRVQLARVGIKTTEPRPGSRKKPSGEVLHWELVNITDPALDNAPFFIHWDDARMHPAKNAPGGCTFASIELADPGSAALTRINRALGFDFPIHSATKPSMTVALRCGDRAIRFPDAHP